MRLLVINISSSTPDINKLRRLLPGISVTTCGSVVRRRRVDNNWPARSETMKNGSAYFTCIWRRGSRQNIAMPFGVVKPEWLGYPMVKIFWIYVYSFWHNPRTWRTDAQTDTAWRHRPRLYSIARQLQHNSEFSRFIIYQQNVSSRSALCTARPAIVGVCHVRVLCRLSTGVDLNTSSSFCHRMMAPAFEFLGTKHCGEILTGSL